MKQAVAFFPQGSWCCRSVGSAILYVEKLKEQQNEEIDEQKKLLQTCLQEKEALKKKSRQNIRNQVKGVFDTIVEENKKLREENAKLKAQIEELRI